MTTKKQLRDIVKRLGLVDLGEAQYYWERERTHMTTMQELQAIVEQLGLVDLGEAQQYWEQGNMDEDVRYPTAKAEGLCLNSTATQHTFSGVLLWLHRPTHQGVLTRRPFLSSLAG